MPKLVFAVVASFAASLIFVAAPAVAQPCTTTAKPVLTAPANASQHAENQAVDFAWTAVSGALRYELLITPDHGQTFESIETTQSTTASEKFAKGDYGWTVKAHFSANCATFSEPRAFQVVASNASCPNSAPVALAPQDGAKLVTSPVTFRWRESAGAKEYRLFAAIDDDDPQLLGTTDQTTLTIALPTGQVVWSVEARFGNDACPSLFSARSTFSVATSATCDRNPAPQLIEPANGAAQIASPARFRWTRVDGAIGYRLYIAADNAELTFVAQTDATELERIVPVGRVRWQVGARFAGCPETRSAISTFTVPAENCPTQSVTLTAPAANATVTSPVRFTWDAVANARLYRLWVARDNDSPALLHSANATTATVALPGGKTSWYVEAVLDRDCPPAVSERRALTVTASSNCASNQPPQITSPANGADITGAVTFRWSVANGAIGYRLWLARDDEPFADVVTTTETSVVRNLDAADYTFYVETFFAGCDPLESAHVEFRVHDARPRCSSEKAMPLTPPNKASTSAPVHFSWTSVANAVGYRVFASLDGAEPQLIGATEETSLIRALPPGVVKWAVTTLFDQCPSTLSESFEFVIARAENCATAKPQLLAPADGASELQSPVLLAWEPVPGAVRYLIVVSRNDGAEAILGETIETSFNARLTSGRYRWSIVAFFANCPQQRSDARTFTIAQPAACDNNRRPFLLAPPQDSVATAKVTFEWTAVPRATAYNLFVEADGKGESLLATTNVPRYDATLPGGRIQWRVEALFADCPSLESSRASFTVLLGVACGTPFRPDLFAIGQALADTTYTVRWTAIPNAQLYELQESSDADFTSPTTYLEKTTSRTFRYRAAAVMHYRVRAISECSDDRGEFSGVVRVAVVARERARNASVELGSNEPVIRTLQLTNPTPVPFLVSADKPWISIEPRTGTVGPQPVTVILTADPANLQAGTNSVTISVTLGSSGKHAAPDAETTTTVPLSISLVTPVHPAGRNTPPPDALIIPAVAHAPGANNSQFESDVRISNIGALPMRYALHFTPSGTDGTVNGSSTTIEVEPGQTTALDDILTSVFGIDAESAATGLLEIRPLSTSTPSTPLGGPSVALTSIASSRTFNVTPNGTFGQWIPAIPFANFIAGSSSPALRSLISLQQIAQSPAYRTNVGFVEGAGEAASLLARIFDKNGSRLAEIPVSLLPGEHKQLPLLALNGITIADGRIEIEVVSTTGKVTAYASVLDNATSDPLLVSPVLLTGLGANRITLPGMAYINNGLANWRSDVRIFNSGTTDVPATLTYYPQGKPAELVAREVTLQAGVQQGFDDILASLYGVTDPQAGGSVVVTTAANAPIVATARTYNQTSSGTYGQFIPGVTPAESVGVADRSLQLLQLEHSTRFRTNIGVVETTGNPATVEVSAILPDSRVSPVVPINLRANEFFQFSLANFGLGSSVYNARVTVKVISGSGKVTAYGSVIDMITQDPTYVPAQ